jgi:hypothetical protein
MVNTICSLLPNTDDAPVHPGGIVGICPVCATTTVFSGFTDNVRESGFCSLCRSYNRQRQMAVMIRRVCSQNSLGAFKFPKTFSIFNTESNGSLHNALKNAANYTCSEYFGPQIASGTLVDGVMHQDLQALGFESDAFNLVLSSDVLEHMPSPYLAHQEIFRVLKPGGSHIFTVPFNPNAELDDVRAVLQGDEIKYFGEKLFHGDPVRPNEGILVWTIFGLQMLERLREIGFDVSCSNLNARFNGIIGTWALVFVARKPPAGLSDTPLFTL